MLLMKLILTLVLSRNAGFAPLITEARVTTNMSGTVCLVWTSEDADQGLSCWDTNQVKTTWKQLKLHHPGVYTVYAAAGNVKSNMITVEVR